MIIKSTLLSGSFFILLQPLRCGLADLRKPWVVDEIDFNDLQNLEDCVERSLIENGNEGMLRCGWQ